MHYLLCDLYLSALVCLYKIILILMAICFLTKLIMIAKMCKHKCPSLYEQKLRAFVNFSVDGF